MGIFFVSKKTFEVTIQIRASLSTTKQYDQRKYANVQQSLVFRPL